MMTTVEYRTYEARLALAECDYELAKLNADSSGASCYCNSFALKGTGIFF